LDRHDVAVFGGLGQPEVALKAKKHSTMNTLKNTTVLVLGLGHSGLAMARWCVHQGAQVRAWDSRANPPMASVLGEELPQVQRLQGGLDVGAALDGVSCVLKSPGLAPTDPSIQGLLAAARQRGMTVGGELLLFTQALAALNEQHGYQPKVAAITGTNGKTTTTALTALLMERAGLSVATAGNIGPTMLDTLKARCLDVQDPSHWPKAWVLELSSFQLDDAQGEGAPCFDPTVATVLNVSQDHLDWHGSLEAYVAAKKRIFGPHTTLVINRDDDEVAAMAPDAPAFTVATEGVKPKAARKKVKDTRRVVRFGTDAPQKPGDFGLVIEGGMGWLVRALDDSAGGHRHDSDVLIQRLMPADAMRLRGRHNAANALAALAIADAMGCAVGPMLHGLREYRGEPHRVQSVGSVGDIEAFDDSKGTNVGATVAAIEGLGLDREPSKLVVVLGGDGKGQDFSPLRKPVALHARAVALIGRDAALVEAALQGSDVPMATFKSLEEATGWCFEQARSGDAVLLSPACASLDMFRNYEHRAEVFVQCVQEQMANRGEVTA
jgi:UDP-N-acetylmuramoylalanine--D-glutamate ligase